jgi:hypothetical protein
VAVKQDFFHFLGSDAMQGNVLHIAVGIFSLIPDDSDPSHPALPCCKTLQQSGIQGNEQVQMVINPIGMAVEYVERVQQTAQKCVAITPMQTDIY